MPRPTPPWRRWYRSRRSTHRSTGWPERPQGEATDGPIEVGTGLGGFFTTHSLWDPWKNGIFPYMNGWFLWFSCKEIYQATMDFLWDLNNVIAKLDHLFPQVVWGENFPKIFETATSEFKFFPMTILAKKKHNSSKRRRFGWTISVGNWIVGQLYTTTLLEKNRLYSGVNC